MPLIDEVDTSPPEPDHGGGPIIRGIAAQAASYEYVELADLIAQALQKSKLPVLHYLRRMGGH